MIKEFTCQCRRLRRRGFISWVGKIPWRRKWQLTPVFLPGKFHGQKSLAGYSPWSHQELDGTEWPSLHGHIYPSRYSLTKLNDKILLFQSYWQCIYSDLFSFFLFLRFIYLFLAALVLCYCENFSLLAVSGAALSCDTWASHYSGFSCCGAQPLECIGVKLWCMGLVATRHVGSSRSRNWTCVPWIGRRLLNHWTTRETCRPIF